MKYKEGDVILCSISDSSTSPYDVFEFTIASISFNIYTGFFGYLSSASKDCPIEFTECCLGTYVDNYKVAHSPLAKALS